MQFGLQWKPISECFLWNVNYVHKIRNICVHGISYVMICTIVHSELHELSLQFVMYNHWDQKDVMVRPFPVKKK